MKCEAAELLEFTRMTGAVVQALRECPMPVIASVNGVAAGAGSVLALASDFRLLAELRLVRVPLHARRARGRRHGVGLPAAARVGLGRATELLMLGDKVGAGAGGRDRARERGRRRRRRCSSATRELARRLADGPALAYATTKVMLTRELDMDLAGAIELEAMTQALLMKSDDFAEFYVAWSEGRKPAWRGR